MKSFKRGILIITGLAVSAALIVACASGAASGSAGGRTAGGNFLSTVSWDAEYDVVVIGFGGAGASAAITAADAGARVLLLEKAPEGEEGGNTRYSAQLVLSPRNRASAIAYYKALRAKYDNQGDDVISLNILNMAERV